MKNNEGEVRHIDTPYLQKDAYDIDINRKLKMRTALRSVSTSCYPRDKFHSDRLSHPKSVPNFFLVVSLKLD